MGEDISTNKEGRRLLLQNFGLQFKVTVMMTMKIGNEETGFHKVLIRVALLYKEPIITAKLVLFRISSSVMR